MGGVRARGWWNLGVGCQNSHECSSAFMSGSSTTWEKQTADEHSWQTERSLSMILPPHDSAFLHVGSQAVEEGRIMKGQNHGSRSFQTKARRRSNPRPRPGRRKIKCRFETRATAERNAPKKMRGIKRAKPWAGITAGLSARRPNGSVGLERPSPLLLQPPRSTS